MLGKEQTSVYMQRNVNMCNTVDKTNVVCRSHLHRYESKPSPKVLQVTMTVATLLNIHQSSILMVNGSVQI